MVRFLDLLHLLPNYSFTNMPEPAIIVRQSEPREIHLVGIGLGHSMTPLMHNYMAKSLDIPWRVLASECLTIDDAQRIFRAPDFAGGIVTMPWKGEIMKHLDWVDDVARMLHAVNVVYLDDEERLCGSNTDWIGIENALRAEGSAEKEMRASDIAAVIGAGGAARAAVYALASRFGAKQIYILNRDDDEVIQLIRDCSPLGCLLVHVTSLEQAKQLEPPSKIVGSVPDLEAKSAEEIAIKVVLAHFLETAEAPGVMLDMCYHPSPQTRNLELARSCGWHTVQGSQVILQQVVALWRFWVHQERLQKNAVTGMRDVLEQAIQLDSKGRRELNAQIIHSHFGSG